MTIENMEIGSNYLSLNFKGTPNNINGIGSKVVVFKKNEIQLYYGGSDWLHYGWRNGSLCLATLRPDGFAGYTPKITNKPATVITTAIDYDGQAISISADVGMGGSIKVIVLNEEGEEITISKAVSKTCTDKVIHLEKSVMSKKIRFKFELINAKLYSFNFGYIKN